MTGPELARLLGPLVGPAGRRRLGPLATGATNDVAMRYEEIKDWKALSQLLVDRADVLQLYDGAEWFIIAIEDLKDEQGT